MQDSRYQQIKSALEQPELVDAMRVIWNSWADTDTSPKRNLFLASPKPKKFQPKFVLPSVQDHHFRQIIKYGPYQFTHNPTTKFGTKTPVTHDYHYTINPPAVNQDGSYPYEAMSTAITESMYLETAPKFHTTTVKHLNDLDHFCPPRRQWVGHTGIKRGNRKGTRTTSHTD